jgi:hypothetical protein
MDANITFGTKTFPKFGGGVASSKSAAAINTVNTNFDGLTTELKAIPVVAGNEIYAQNAWIKLVEAQQMFLLALGGVN